MSISYEVGALFTIKDDATPSLRRIASELKAVNEQIERTKAQLSSLGASAFNGLSGKIGVVGDQLKALGGVADSTSRQIVGVGEAGDASMKSLGLSIGTIDDAFKTLGRSADIAAGAIGDAFKGMTTSIGSALDELRVMQAQLMQTGAAAGAVGGAPGALRARGTGAHGSGSRLHGHLPSPIHGVSVNGGGDGLVPAAIGGFTLYELVKGGFETQHWIAQMEAEGASKEQIAAAYNTAVQQAGLNNNSTITGNMKMILEAKKAIGDWGEANSLMPSLAVSSYAMQSVKAEDLHSKFNENGQILNFGRALEEMGVTQMGATSEEREANMKKYSAALLKTMISKRGAIAGDDLFALTNNSGGAAMNWDFDFATSIAPIMAAEVKAGKLGNADYMALRGYSQGHLPEDVVKQLRGFDINGKHISLLGDADTQEVKPGVWKLKPNSGFADGLDANPWKWSGGLLERLKAQGIDIGDQEEMNKVVNVLASNKSQAQFFRNLLEPRARGLIEKELRSRDQVPDNAAGILQRDDPLLRLDALKNKLSDLFSVLGGPLTDTAIQAIGHLTDVLRGMSQLLAENPTLQKGASVGLAALAGGALINGVGKLLGLGSLFGGGGGAAGGAAGGGILARALPWLFGSTASALALPLALGGDTSRKDPTADDYARAKAAEKAYAAAHGGFWGSFWGSGGGGGSTAPSAETLRALDRARSSINPAFHGDAEQIREHNRGNALSKLPAPQVSVHTDVQLQNNVHVSIDGKEIAAQIEASVVKKFEHSTTAPGFDPHGSFTGPDMNTMAT